MSKPFKLSATLYGHSMDVRAVHATADNCIISGSRDTTAKFWKPNGPSTYADVMTYRDQKKYVTSVLYLEPSDLYPNGLVLAGGNDNIIFVYQAGEPFASLQLTEHTNAVCALSSGLEPNTFFSGSWDTTAKFWNLNSTNSKNSIATFEGHKAAVWGVIQLQNSTVVTASADRTIAFWSNVGERLKVLDAHKDCVRALADFPELNLFMSVSNDASIKVWTYSGENLDTYYGHTNFIYSIARNRAGGENCFVTSDEDRTVKFWKDGQNTQSIHLPAQSVWSVACTNNGDIITGSSDGVVRIFTQDESRFASADVLKTFEDEVNALQKQAVQEIGGIKVSDLPGVEALYDPGQREGQMKMIREPHGVVAYTWVDDGENSHWKKVGDVLGGTDKTNEGGTMYEGKAYDYVFSVDVEDGKPPLKLPYNRGEDPYHAAHNFIQKNFLPAEYLEQIVQFILKNSEEVANPALNPDFVDPFTGGSRYTPTSGTSGQNFSTGQNLDPFTGHSSYSTSTVTSADVKFFPVTTYKTFDSGDPAVILQKLKEFNKKTGDGSGGLDEMLLENAVKACLGPISDRKYIDVLFEMLKWPEDALFPVIDVMRMAVKYNENNMLIAAKDNGAVLKKLKIFLGQPNIIPNNTLLTFRFLCNLFVHKTGEDLIYENRIELLEDIAPFRNGNKNMQVALSTFLLNLGVLSIKRRDNVTMLLLADVATEILVELTDPEAQFRVYVLLGTLLTYGSAMEKDMMRSKMKENKGFVTSLEGAVATSSNDLEVKRKKCAGQVRAELFK